MKGCCKLTNSSRLILARSGWINCPGDLLQGSAPPLTSLSSSPHLQASQVALFIDLVRGPMGIETLVEDLTASVPVPTWSF
jgi:hypothetical protein